MDEPRQSPAVGVRTAAEVWAIRDNITYIGQKYGNQPFDQGVDAAYAWVLGELPAAPLTGTPTPGGPSVHQLHQEDDAAHEALSGRLTADRTRDWINGYQHACAWLRGATDVQPWPMVG